VNLPRLNEPGKRNFFGRNLEMKRIGISAVIFFLFCHINVYGLVTASLEGAGGVFSYQSQEHVRARYARYAG
jgi:hypothetical protein